MCSCWKVGMGNGIQRWPWRSRRGGELLKPLIEERFWWSLIRNHHVIRRVTCDFLVFFFESERFGSWVLFGWLADEYDEWHPPKKKKKIQIESTAFRVGGSFYLLRRQQSFIPKNLNLSSQTCSKIHCSACFTYKIHSLIHLQNWRKQLRPGDPKTFHSNWCNWLIRSPHHSVSAWGIRMGNWISAKWNDCWRLENLRWLRVRLNSSSRRWIRHSRKKTESWRKTHRDGPKFLCVFVGSVYVPILECSDLGEVETVKSIETIEMRVESS